MNDESSGNPRRGFLKAGSIAVVSIAALRAGLAEAQTSAAKDGKKDAKTSAKSDGAKDAKSAAPKLSESDPQAQALGYKEDAAKVDRKKSASYQPGQVCSGCIQFEGSAKDAYAPCKAFAGKQVNAKGWCAAWVKKA